VGKVHPDLPSRAGAKTGDRGGHSKGVLLRPRIVRWVCNSMILISQEGWLTRRRPRTLRATRATIMMKLELIVIGGGIDREEGMKKKKKGKKGSNTT
jgi:hypothetical protein